MKKGTKVIDIKKVITDSNEVGIKNVAYILLGFPTETKEEIEKLEITLLNDNELFNKCHNISKDIKDLKQYHIDTKNPICVISIKKNKNQKELFKELKPLFKHIKILVIVDDKNIKNFPTEKEHRNPNQHKK